MKIRKPFPAALFAGVSFVVSFGVMNASLHAETLEGAVQTALLSHPSIATAETGSEIAGEQKREERSGYFPDVSIAGSGGRIYNDNATSRGFTTTRGAAYSGYWDGSITARQMIFDGFQTSNKVDAAKARQKSAQMNIIDVKEKLSFSVAQAYIDLLRAKKGLNLLSAHAKKVADYEQRIKNMVDEGAADEAEHQQARDIRVILENMVTEYEGQVRTAEAYYTELTGNIPAEELEVPSPRTDLIPAQAEEAIDYAKANHAALKSASLMSKSAEFDAKAEKGALYPAVDGELSYLESEKKDVIGGELVDGRALVRLNWAFETGGAQLARIEQKKLKQKEAGSQTQEIERQIERGIRLSYAEYKTALQQIDTQKRRLELNEKLFDTYNVQFEGARISLLQLMQSDNQLFTTKLEKMNGEYRLLAAEYGILASMGRLQESLADKQVVARSEVKQQPLATPSLTKLTTDDQK